MPDPAETLEQALVAALRANDDAAAHTIATALHERGFDLDALNVALAAHPQLEEPLWALLHAVIPLSRRAQKRRAIRAAEERDWGDWEDGKRGKP
jgi:hypothetical protein